MRFSFSLFLLSAGYHTVKADWRPELPWDELASSIAGELIDTSPENYLQECATEFDKAQGSFDPSTTWSRSMHGMINKPSGLCLSHFFCAFNNCAAASPDDDHETSSVLTYLVDNGYVPNPTLYSEMNATIKAWFEETSNQNYNLPTKVLFPNEAKDVVASVKFAKEHNLEISVKNSGASFTSASSKGNTLHLNMNRYYPYSTNDGVVDCDADNVSEGLSDQPCRLSLSKGKNALIRVGGGENWGKVYSAVRKANDAQADGYKYHAVGGASANVSPMGWTFSAGLSGTAAGRMLGFGVDQILQIEMVLPNGSHVKFGPTEWQMESGFDVPKTLSVTGLCNTNPEDTEENWVWEECPEEKAVNFNDLWFAVKGGGGGTWGVVLSMYLQLHEYMPYEMYTPNPTACITDKLDDTQKAAFNYFYQTFQIKFWLDPASIDVSEDDSNACGGQDFNPQLSCFGGGSATVFDKAWKAFLTTSRDSLENAGIAPDIIDETLNCDIFYYEGSGIVLDVPVLANPNSTVIKYKDYLQYVTLPNSTDFPGLGLDSPFPGYSPIHFIAANILVPKKWILDNIEFAAQNLAPHPNAYRAFGGKTSSAASDQMNSISDAHREAGYMYQFPFIALYNDLFFTDTFPQVFDTSDKSNFPSFLGANHAGINTRGPLKSDWTKACPLEWTQKERDEKCISLQECVWGTKLLKRLEEIKEAIDPNYMFDCNGCIGNNRVKVTPAPTDAPTDAPTEPPSAPTSSAFYASNRWMLNLTLLCLGALAAL